MTKYRKDVYTTGQVADLCGLSQQTVIRCFERGELEGFKIPGSRDRRIPEKALLKFMQKHGIPFIVSKADVCPACGQKRD